MAIFYGIRYVYAILVCCYCSALLLIPHRISADPAVVPVANDTDDYYEYPVNSDDVSYDDNATDTLDDKRQRMMQAWAGDNTSYVMTPTERNAWNPDVSSRDSLPPCVRKEYRTLTDQERTKFHSAMQLAKTQFIDKATGSTWLNLCTLNHLYSSSPEAHNSPVFLPFHRCFLQRLEAFLRSIDPTVCLCYWASTMDSFLPDWSWSMMWSDKLMGTAYGPVISGCAANWGIVPSVCTQTWPTLYREMSNDATLLISDVMIANYMNTPNYVDTTSPTNTYWEMCHGGVHVGIGGHMADLRCAPGDPMFYLHHCYIDYLWEQWRKKYGTGAYPNVNTRNQRASDPILPWSTPTIIAQFSAISPSPYAPCPSNCTQNSHCNSPVLWCNKNYGGPNVGRCMAGIAEGGPCVGFPDDACCFTCANYAPPICNKTTNVCQCVTPCTSDRNCLPSQWCCLAQQRCMVQLPLGSQCINETLINRACIGSCFDPNDTPPDPGFNRTALCYESRCQCCDVQM